MGTSDEEEDDDYMESDYDDFADDLDDGDGDDDDEDYDDNDGDGRSRRCKEISFTWNRKSFLVNSPFLEASF